MSTATGIPQIDPALIDVDLDAIRLITGPEMPGLVGAAFQFNNPEQFAVITPDECRQLAAALLQAADAAALVTL